MARAVSGGGKPAPTLVTRSAAQRLIQLDGLIRQCPTSGPSLLLTRGYGRTSPAASGERADGHRLIDPTSKGESPPG